jgi:hypothetical protein
MKPKNKTLIIVFIAVLALASILIGWKYLVLEKPLSGPPPVLKNLGVDFAPYDPSTGRAGAFVFTDSEDKVFLEFGAVVQGPEGPKVLPTFEYIVSSEADVYAVCDGIVLEIRYQKDTQDYEVLIAPTADSPWRVSHDHVRDLKVSEGNKVTAGDVLGKPGTFSDNLGRTEIMVFKNQFDKSLAYAPFKFFDPKLSEEYQQKVWRLMEDWESFKNDLTIYDQKAMTKFYAGCLYEELPA